jgi:phosphatidate phosphatase APP1
VTDARPHLAGLVEERWNLGLAAVLARRGWRHLVLAHAGYGGAEFVRVLARVVLAPPRHDPGNQPGDQPGHESGAGAALLQRRGWRNFVTAEAIGVPVTVTVAGQRHTVRTDRSGNVDARLANPGLPPGWAEITLQAPDSPPVTARVLVIGDDVDLGIVSDIDDTVLSTFLPRPLLAAYNTFLAREEARRPVPGMASLYERVLADRPGAPTVYVSTGAWNTAPTLRRFLSRTGLPEGPLLLTDWGPTNTGWFRSGQDHKRACLEWLAADFPRIRWVLVGDDGQHDPAIYAEFARAHPERVRAIAIRELPMAEQVLAHGTPTTLADGAATQGAVPEVRGADGEAIAERLLRLL